MGYNSVDGTKNKLTSSLPTQLGALTELEEIDFGFGSKFYGGAASVGPPLTHHLPTPRLAFRLTALADREFGEARVEQL